MATQTVCSFNQFGYCKYKEACRKPHVDDLYDIFLCEFLTFKLRHPRKCNWYSEYGRCKFNPCKFKHTDDINDISSVRKESAVIASKLIDIESSLKNLEEIEEEIKCTIDQLKEDSKIKSEHFEKQLSENNEKIRNLELNIEKKFEMFESNLNSLKQYIEKLEQRFKSKPDKINIKIRCSQCDYEGNSQHGLKVHMAKKHTALEEIKSNKYDLCDEKFKNSTDLKRHRKSHSFNLSA